MGRPDPLPPHDPHCLGCGPDNPHGHRLAVHREAAGVVTVRYVFDDRHAGAPGIAHGGAVATVLDDLCGFLLYDVGAPAVTARLAVDYRKPVLLDTPYRFTARLTGREGRKLFATADGHAEDGAAGPVVTAEALFVVVDPSHFQRVRRPPAAFSEPPPRLAP